MTYRETEWNMHERGVQTPPGANRHLGLYSRQELTYLIILTHNHFFPRHLFSALFSLNSLFLFLMHSQNNLNAGY